MRCRYAQAAWLARHLERLPTCLRDHAYAWYVDRACAIRARLRADGWPIHAAPDRGYPRGWPAETEDRARTELAHVCALADAPVVRWAGGLGVDGDDIATAAEALVARAYDYASRHGIAAATRHMAEIADGIPGEPTAQWLRATDAAWWRRGIRRELRWRREAVWALIAPKRVQWVSPDGLSEHRAGQRAQARWLASHQMVPDDGGEPVGLDTLAEGRDRRRHAELLARTAGIAEIAADAGMEPRLMTITVPGRMHPTTSAGGGRRANPHYDGTTPRGAHQWAMDRWARWRAAIERYGIGTHWCIGVQPHKDGCPHYHAVIWARPGDWPEAEWLAYRHWWSTDPDPHATPDRRIRIDHIQGGHGGAVAYCTRVIAYLTRQVDGDDADEAERATAWASAHGIRRYRTSETHATVWRYLRRRDVDATPVGPDAVAAQQAARDGDYAAFLAARAAAGLRPAYRGAETRYGEPARRICGVRAGDVVIVPSRTWALTRKSLIRRARTVMQDVPRAAPDGPPAPPRRGIALAAAPTRGPPPSR